MRFGKRFYDSVRSYFKKSSKNTSWKLFFIACSNYEQKVPKKMLFWICKNTKRYILPFSKFKMFFISTAKGKVNVKDWLSGD